MKSDSMGNPDMQPLLTESTQQLLTDMQPLFTESTQQLLTFLESGLAHMSSADKCLACKDVEN